MENTHNIRNAMFESLREKLQGIREEVWIWMKQNGPKTTEQIATGSGIDLLTVRPRVTELCQLGFAKCIGREKGAGVYQALTLTEARARFDSQANPQMELFS